MDLKNSKLDNSCLIIKTKTEKIFSVKVFLFAKNFEIVSIMLNLVKVFFLQFRFFTRISNSELISVDKAWSYKQAL